MSRLLTLAAVVWCTFLFAACQSFPLGQAPKKNWSPREVQLLRDLAARIESGWPAALTLELSSDVNTQKEAAAGFKRFLRESPFLRGSPKKLSFYPVVQSKDYFFTGLKPSKRPAFLFIKKGQRTVYLIYSEG